MRLIDADALRNEINGNLGGVLMQIDSAPTIDAEPVRHGRWMPMKRYRSEYVCSECGDIWPDFKSDYCPNCGADMRGGDNT